MDILSGRKGQNIANGYTRESNFMKDVYDKMDPIRTLNRIKRAETLDDGKIRAYTSDGRTLDASKLETYTQRHRDPTPKNGGIPRLSDLETGQSYNLDEMLIRSPMPHVQVIAGLGSNGSYSIRNNNGNEIYIRTVVGKTLLAPGNIFELPKEAIIEVGEKTFQLD